MSTWVLILFFVGPAVVAHDFADKSACERAIVEAKALAAVVRGVCVPKATEVVKERSAQRM